MDEAAADVLVLGPVAVRRGEQVVVPPGLGTRAMIGTLGLAGPNGMGVDLLAEALWADRAAEKGRSAFDVALHRARAWLYAAVGDAVRIERAGTRCVLAGRTDHELFRRQVVVAGELTGTARAGLLAGALALWRGDPLADVPTRTLLQPLITELHQVRRDAVVGLGRLLLELGRPQEASAAVVELAERELLDEPLQAVLIEALAEVGRQAEALHRFEELRARLGDELGVDPGPELSATLLRVLRKEFGEPARPVPAIPTVVPAQLPPDNARFTGRADQLAALDAMLHDSGSVVISALAGIGGVGKTTLAVHWAHRVANRFPDGQLHIDLRGYAPADPVTPGAALGRFLRALGVPADQVPDDVAEASALYRSLLAGRRVLVLLDNARTIEQLRPLLPAAPGCLALITSRDRLHGLVTRAGASRLNLDMLTEAESLALLTDVLGAERIQADPQAAAELAKRCGHLPLALSIVASGLLAQPELRIADQARLLRRDRLDELSVPGDPALSVRSAFDLSYDLLSTSDQRLFRLLGDAPGQDITTAAAALLTTAPEHETRHALGRLVNAHLVQQNGDRYSLHDLIGDYARDRSATETDPHERAAALSTLCHWYLHGAVAAARNAFPDTAFLTDLAAAPIHGDRGGRAWLEDELANLVAVAQAATELGHGDVAWQLADALRPLAIDRRDRSGWLAIGHAAVAGAEAAGDHRGRTVAHLCLSIAHHLAGELEPASEHAERSLAASRHARWATGQASALNMLAIVENTIGRLASAIRRYQEAVACSPTPQLTLLIRANLAVAYGDHGELFAAVDSSLAALRESRELGHRRREAMLLANLGDLYVKNGQFATAAATLAEAQDVVRNAHHPRSAGTTLCALASLAHESGDRQRARDLAESSWAHVQDANDPRHEVEAAVILGHIHHSAGDERRAEDWFRRAARAARDHDDVMFEGQALAGLALAQCRLGLIDKAIGHAQGALTVAVQGQYRLVEVDALRALGAIYFAQGRLDLAHTHTKRAAELGHECGARPREARSLRLLGDIERARGDHHGAASYWQAAHALFADMGTPEADELLAALAVPGDRRSSS